VQFFSLPAIFFKLEGESTKFVAAAHHSGLRGVRMKKKIVSNYKDIADLGARHGGEMTKPVAGSD
jgi:hypothetical protein